MPATNYAGEDAIRFILNDGQLDSAEAVLRFQIDAVADAPTLQLTGRSGQGIDNLIVAACVWNRSGSHLMPWPAHINCIHQAAPTQIVCNWTCIPPRWLALHRDRTHGKCN